MKTLTRDDTEHGVEYVTKAEAEAEIQAALDKLNELRTAVQSLSRLFEIL